MVNDNKSTPAEEEEILNPRVKGMTDETLRSLQPRDPVTMDMLDYREPIRDAKWFKNRCEYLGILLPDSYYEIMALYETGIRPKQHRSMLKKERRKRMTRIIHGTKVLSF